jgi:hypothetical protein
LASEAIRSLPFFSIHDYSAGRSEQTLLCALTQQQVRNDLALRLVGLSTDQLVIGTVDFRRDACCPA